MFCGRSGCADGFAEVLHKCQHRPCRLKVLGVEIWLNTPTEWLIPVLELTTVVRVYQILPLWAVLLVMIPIFVAGVRFIIVNRAPHGCA